MSKFTADLKWIRQQVERAQAVTDGQKSLDAMVLWNEQNESSVNQKTSRMQEEFVGLVVHLTPEPSPTEVTLISTSGVSEQDTLSQNDVESLKRGIVRSLDSRSSQNDPGAD